MSSTLIGGRPEDEMAIYMLPLLNPFIRHRVNPETMDYIVCHQRKSLPTISTVVCEKCKRMGKCADYQAYLNPSLFPVQSKQEIMRKKIKLKKIECEENSVSGPEQLTFNLGRNKK